MRDLSPTLKMTVCGWTFSKGTALATALHMVTPNEYTSHLGPAAPALLRNSGAWYPGVPTSFCTSLVYLPEEQPKSPNLQIPFNQTSFFSSMAVGFSVI